MAMHACKLWLGSLRTDITMGTDSKTQLHYRTKPCKHYVYYNLYCFLRRDPLAQRGRSRLAALPRPSSRTRTSPPEMCPHSLWGTGAELPPRGPLVHQLPSVLDDRIVLRQRDQIPVWLSSSGDVTSSFCNAASSKCPIKRAYTSVSLRTSACLFRRVSRRRYRSRGLNHQAALSSQVLVGMTESR